MLFLNFPSPTLFLGEDYKDEKKFKKSEGQSNLRQFKIEMEDRLTIRLLLLFL